MNLWTDGTVVVHACEKMGAVRVIRDGVVVAESSAGYELGWPTPLAVDVAADRIWAGGRVHEFRLSDASLVAVHEDRVRALVALADGRLAAILSPVAGRDGEACRLAIGAPGRWERRLKLHRLGKLCRRGPFGEPRRGLSMTDEVPESRAFLSHYLSVTVTGQGLVVGDGGAGCVAHFTADLELVGFWKSGGADEIELTGYATPRGVLVTARWAARESLVGWLTANEPEPICEGYDTYAIPADGERFWLADDHQLALRNHAGEVVATVSNPLQFGPISAAHGSGLSCVAGTHTRLYLATASDEAIVARTIHLRGLVDVTGVFEPGKDPLNHLLRPALSALPGVAMWSSAIDNDNRPHVTVPEVRPDRVPPIEAVFRAHGATRVDVVDSRG